MRRESYGLETYSPSLDRDLTDCKISDFGDLELPFGDTLAMVEMVREMAAKILADGKTPFLFGGEHTVTLGAVQAAFEKYSGLRLIHFDAHADLRGDYLGVRLSHACVIRRCWELFGDGRIFQFGIRSGERGEFEWAQEHTSLTRFDFGGLEQAVSDARQVLLDNYGNADRIENADLFGGLNAAGLYAADGDQIILEYLVEAGETVFHISITCPAEAEEGFASRVLWMLRSFALHDSLG